MPNFYGPVDLTKNELRNAVVQNLGAAPSSPLKGQIYMDSTANVLYWYNGTAWISAAGATMSSTVTTAAIGDTAAAGVASQPSAGDHRHGMPAFGAVTAATTYGIAAGNGAAVSVPRSDHTHGTPSLSAVVAVNQNIGDAATAGVATAPSPQDHRHGMPAFGAITQEGTFGTLVANGSAVTIARSDHGHGNPTHDSTAHNAISLTALQPPTGNYSFNGQALTNLQSPTNPTDGANKSYVDNAVAGLSWKQAVRVASAVGVNVASITGFLVIDGVTTVNGDRVLLKDQTTQSQNGIYVAASGAWVRSTDADVAAELLQATVYVEEGTTMADTAWTCTANAPITVGTTNLPFIQFAGGGTVTAGAGMTQSGNVLNVIAGDTSLTVNADELHVNTGVIATVASVTAAVTGMAKKFAAALAGTASPEVITHNLNTRDIQLTVLNGASPYTAVEVDWDATSVNTATIRYNPTLGAGYRAVVVG